ncbi:hypothetical protein ACS0TY_000807 [Phlomoides rotata]
MRNKELRLLFLIIAFLSFCNHPYSATPLENYDQGRGTIRGHENKIAHEGGGGGQPTVVSGVNGGGSHTPYVQQGGGATPVYAAGAGNNNINRHHHGEGNRVKLGLASLVVTIFTCFII